MNQRGFTQEQIAKAKVQANELSVHEYESPENITLGLQACGFRLIVREPKQPTIYVRPRVIGQSGSGKKKRKRKQN